MTLHDDSDEAALLSLLAKSDVWNYEKEYAWPLTRSTRENERSNHCDTHNNEADKYLEHCKRPVNPSGMIRVE